MSHIKVVRVCTAGNHKAVVKWDREWEEYRVDFFTGDVCHHEASYHTDDKEDAVITAEAEVKRMLKYENKG